MEDNEFEEVTIISHTDRPHRVFSEKSIEKLKEQISLELVKKLTPLEKEENRPHQPNLLQNVPLEVDDPRLAPGLRELEKLKQDHFANGYQGVLRPRFYFISRVAGESG